MPKPKIRSKKKSKKLVILNQIEGNFGRGLELRSEVSPQPAMCQICKQVIPAHERRVRIIAQVRDTFVTRRGIKLNRTDIKAHRRCISRFMNPSRSTLNVQCYRCLQPLVFATAGTTFRRGRWNYNLCVECMQNVRLDKCVSCHELFMRSDLSPKTSVEDRNWHFHAVGSLWCERCTENYGITTIRSKALAERRDMKFYDDYYKAREQLQELIDGSP